MTLCTSFCASVHINTGNIHPFQKILDSSCISGTDCGFFPENTCYALIILPGLILGMVNNIRINNAYLLVVTGILRNQGSDLLKALLHGRLYLIDLAVCISIARSKNAVITV